MEIKFFFRPEVADVEEVGEWLLLKMAFLPKFATSQLLQNHGLNHGVLKTPKALHFATQHVLSNFENCETLASQIPAPGHNLHKVFFCLFVSSRNIC